MDGPSSNTRKRRSSSAMEIDTSQSSFKFDVTMEGSVATIRGGSLMQIEEAPDIDAETTSRGAKIRVLSAIEMDPCHRRRIHDLEDVLARKDRELQSLASDIESKNSFVTILETNIADLKMDIEDAHQHFKVQNSGAWAKVDELDMSHKKLLQKNVELISRVYNQDHELDKLREHLSTQTAELDRIRDTSEENSIAQNLELECHNLKLQLDALSQSNSSLSSTNTGLRKTKIDLESLVKKLKDEGVTRLNAEKESIDELTKKLSDVQSDCSRLHGKLKLVAQEKTEMGDKLSRVSEEIKQLEDNNSKLTSEASNMQTKLHEAETEKNALEEDNQQLLNDFGVLKEDHDTLKEVTNAQDSLRINFDNLLTMHTSLKEQAEAKIEQMQRALSKLEKLNKESLAAKEAELQSQCYELQNVLGRLTSLNEEKEKEEEKAHQRAQTLVNEKTKLVDEAEAASRRIRELELGDATRIQELRDNMAAANRTIQELVDEKATLE
ncbi:hypothetical protein F5876DRAFT_81526 [Lentinula aff. lateritia]|uniref:Uncharacterized protein n=1 Tax=Lentinula aff. lateritia TaxID=2804960 RepID=A0ACC1TM19_9AGAR|nr:hypothetical protein F5876DRAFT_81526 [Lentinula aff. lateritia]